MGSTISAVLPSVLGAVFLASLAGLLCALGLRSLRKRWRMKRWGRVPGVVRDHRTRSFSSSSGTHVDFQVAFQQGGREHIVWCISPTRAGYGRGAGQGVENEIANRPPGSAVQVYLNPENPQEAYLELPEQHVIVFLFGGSLILAAFAVTVVLQAFNLLPPELVELGFFALMGMVLFGIIISTSIGLFNAPKRAPRKPGRETGKRSSPRRPRSN